MISINHNLSAMNVANTLSGHYGRLQTSTQRLSSGLRVNSAADDAAGLAIRELMRSDIQALGQGIRNANDAISMLQTFDGALSVIDEKLIRMKELAEQAATGTYSSTQRLMIDSEFQAMGEEINRIARATDFNGIKLLDGETLGGAVNALNMRAVMTVGDKDYDVTGTGGVISAWPGASATQGALDLSGITNPEALVGVTNISITNSSIPKMGDKFLLVSPAGGLTEIPPGTSLSIEYLGNRDWIINGFSTQDRPADLPAGVSISGGWNNFTFFDNRDPNAPIRITATVYDPDKKADADEAPVARTDWTSPTATPAFASNVGVSVVTPTASGYDISIDLGNNNVVKSSWNVTAGDDKAISAASIRITVKDVTKQPTGPTDPDDPMSPNYAIPDDVIRIHFGAGADKKEDFYDIRKHDATLKGLGLDGVNIQTQERAQNALVQIGDAIEVKDQIRAEYGANQNRLENTVSNLTIQMENLQSAESRISDSDIAREMMLFVRNQILTQSSIAMLAQANSMPQMVMRLIG